MGEKGKKREKGKDKSREMACFLYKKKKMMYKKYGKCCYKSCHLLLL